MNRPHLFIGGPMHLQIRDVRLGIREFHVPIISSIPRWYSVRDDIQMGAMQLLKYDLCLFRAVMSQIKPPLDPRVLGKWDLVNVMLLRGLPSSYAGQWI